MSKNDIVAEFGVFKKLLYFWSIILDICLLDIYILMKGVLKGQSKFVAWSLLKIKNFKN